MKAFDIVAMGVAVAAALAYLVVHFVRAAQRKNPCADCPGCGGAARDRAMIAGPVHRTTPGGGCPGCG